MIATKPVEAMPVLKMFNPMWVNSWSVGRVDLGNDCVDPLPLKDTSVADSFQKEGISRLCAIDRNACNRMTIQYLNLKRSPGLISVQNPLTLPHVVPLQIGGAFIAREADNPTVIIAEGGASMVVALARLDTLIDMQAVRGMTKHNGIVDMVLKKFIDDGAPFHQVSMCLFFVRRHRDTLLPLDDTLSGARNKMVTRYIEKNWPHCRIERDEIGAKLNLESLFIEQIRRLGVRQGWSVLHPYVSDDSSQDEKNMLVIRRNM